MKISAVSDVVMSIAEPILVRSVDTKPISKNVLTNENYSAILSENLGDGGSCNDSVSTYHNVE